MSAPWTALHAEVAAFIAGGPGDFEALALRAFAHQVAHNADYRAFAAGAQPQTWAELPAVPVALFRHLGLSAAPPESWSVVFRTSGTTGARGVVRLPGTRLYDLGARAHAEAVVGPIPAGGVALVPDAPDSSLGHMCFAFSPALRRCFGGAAGPAGTDVDGAWAALRAFSDAGIPVFVPGTAFALAELLGRDGPPVPLADGSVVMVTGGYKGWEVALSPEALRAALRARLPGARHVEEYGMTELGSQLWAPAHGEPFAPPRWLRALAVDPVDGRPARVGLLRFIDLANLDTVVAIETRDVGEVLPDGRVVLHGRLPGAPPRGCSLTADEAAAGPRVGVIPDAPPPRAAGRLHHPLTGDRLEEPLPLVFHGHPHPPPPLSAADATRVAAVLRGLARLGRMPAAPLSDGLLEDTAREGLSAAIGAITEGGLARELATPGARPARVAVVAARGVFTAPLEWAALWAAAGAEVHLKAPRGAGGLCAALAACLRAEGLPVTSAEDRDLRDPDAIVAFGSDASMAALPAASPRARVAAYGHRVSFALVGAEGPGLATALAWDALAYGGRGCMAPAAVLVDGDPAAVVDALAEALPGLLWALPQAPLDPALGPEWRRRVGLARALGEVREGPGWAVLRLPLGALAPAALPGMIVVHGVADGVEARRALWPWRDQLSSLATDDGLRYIRDPAGWEELYSWFPRVCVPGELQRPRFPRRHDGRPMMAPLLGPPEGGRP